jgi:hypothetical protein
MATLRKIKTAERTTTPKAEQALALGTENYRELNITLIDMAHANSNQHSNSRGRRQPPARPATSTLWTAHVPKQLEFLNKQTKELTELGQKLAIRNALAIKADR